MKTDDLIALLARQPDALPRTHPRRDLWVATLVSLVGAWGAMALALGARPDLDAALAAPLFWQKAGTLALLVGFAAWAVYRRGLPGRPTRAASWARWLPAAWLAAATVATVLAAPDGTRLALFHSPTILQCLASIPALAVMPAIAFTWALRRSAPTEPAAAARATGWAAGATGAFAYAFHCQADQPAYVLLWYGLAVGLTILLTQAIAVRWLRW